MFTRFNISKMLKNISLNSAATRNGVIFKLCVHCVSVTMYLLLFVAYLLCGLSNSEHSDDEDLGYGLHIGNAIDVFANYGDLSQVTQVVSSDYDDDDQEQTQEPTEPFREKNIRVFVNVTSQETRGDPVVDMNVLLCDTYEDLMQTYYKNFQIEGIEKPWKAFMGDWAVDEVMRTLGIEHDTKADDCCYVLIKMTKEQTSVKIIDLTNVSAMSYVKRSIEKLNFTDTKQVRKFMKSYGTHYIDSYVTGNFIYQVFKYKRSGFGLLKSYIRQRKDRQMTSETLRFYFSSYFLKQIGEIRIASGNKTIETWAQRNLRDSRYLYSRPSLLRLHYNPILAYKLNELLDDRALLGLNLKILKPLIEDKSKAEKYVEVIENDLKLWEVNS